jgi:hypothetical protein
MWFVMQLFPFRPPQVSPFQSRSRLVEKAGFHLLGLVSILTRFILSS